MRINRNVRKRCLGYALSLRSFARRLRASSARSGARSATLRYSINVTLDGCCNHRAILPDEDLHRHAVENLNRAGALLFGRVTYEMMEAAFRPAWTGEIPDWTGGTDSFV